MDTLDELVNQFKEIKAWKKEITRASILLAAVGVAVGVVGIFIRDAWWVFLILGVVLMIAGALIFFIQRNTVNKAEQKAIEVINSAKIPETRREKIKSELGLK